MKYAEILFDQKVGEDKSTLSYAIPEDINLQMGHLVEISLRNRTTNGIVWEIHDNKPSFKTKAINKVLREKPLLDEKQIEIAKWLSEYYYCPIHKVIKNFVPKRVLQNKAFREKKNEEKEQIIRSKELTLSEEQKKVVDEIKSSPLNTFLIHGVTGSGKTEVYSMLAKETIKQNKQVLILVPEISLTTQNIDYFEKSTGIKATVIHSKLSEGQRYKSWIDIWNNKAKLIIGSRSAIFAPFESLGLIIIDEEHESSYKQDSSPRYHTQQVAKKLQELDPSIKIVLGSATPSVESSEILGAQTLNMTKRIGDTALPAIEIVDLREEFKKGNYSIFSDQLHEAIAQALQNNEQIILFLNRRGSASSVVCRDCGYSVECKSCESTMTHHEHTLSKEALICHHCGQISPVPSTCPLCKSANIRFLGIGTQRIQAELKKSFPQARVLRADKDTTATKNGFKDIYRSFKKHEADILIGTQMIAKGLHLPKVSLVGVILADIGLNIPDFRSSERNFQLMTQVAGRSGRGKSQGKVIIQSYNPEHLSLKYAQENNYEEFFKYERTQRKILNNPPFSQLAKFLIETPSLQKTKQICEELEAKLWQIVRENDLSENIEINSYPAYFTKLRGKYRYIILIKDKQKAVHKLLAKLSKEYIISPNIKIDVDPLSIT